jgi:hypothetical protein
MFLQLKRYGCPGSDGYLFADTGGMNAPPAEDLPLDPVTVAGCMNLRHIAKHTNIRFVAAALAIIMSPEIFRGDAKAKHASVDGRLPHTRSFNVPDTRGGAAPKHANPHRGQKRSEIRLVVFRGPEASSGPHW